MANKCDSNIYGIDENNFAQGVSSDALGKQGSAPTSGGKGAKGVKGLEEDASPSVRTGMGGSADSEGN